MPPRKVKRASCTEVYRADPPDIVFGVSESRGREISFSSGQRKVVYVLGFCLALASGNAWGFILAAVVWAIAHAHATVKG